MDGQPTTATATPTTAARRDDFSRWAVARAWWRLPHPLPILVVLAATTGFALLARRGWPDLAELARLLGAMLGGQLAIGAVNELADLDLDRVAKPDKPLASGLVSERAARRLAGAGLVAMVVLGAPFGPAALALLALGTGLGLAYDLWFKRTALSWLPYVLALPLLPLWVWTALVGFDPMLALLYPLGAAAAVGVHLAQALPDAASDRAAGLDNAVSRLGERGALAVALLCALTAPVVAGSTALLLPGALANPAVVLAGAGAATGFLAVAGALYAANRPLGVRACFPLVASATVLVALAWVLGATGT
jgi:4-hydroxybenzoate polyprenyltransferase